MKLENYSPTFRGVLLQEVKEEKIGSVYTPYSLPEDLKMYTVIKTGKDCQQVQAGDIVKLMRGFIPEPIRFDGAGDYGQAMEQQIIGYFRTTE